MTHGYVLTQISAQGTFWVPLTTSSQHFKEEGQRRNSGHRLFSIALVQRSQDRKNFLLL
jgi:hypothetical protein